MEALYDRTGRVYAWLHETGRIYGLNGRNLAFIKDDSVYLWTGAHLGWWQEGYMRDRNGAVGLFTADAESFGLVRPVRSVKPIKPIRAVAPIKPVKSIRPVRPVRRLAWSTGLPF